MSQDGARDRAGLGSADQLVRRAIEGDRAAHRALFDAHQARVFAYCVVAVRGDRDRAQDLLQETFVRFFQNLSALREPERVRGWLLAIAHSVVTAQVRFDGAQRHKLALLAVELADAPLPTIEPDERAAQIAVVREVIGQIEDARLRTLAELRYLDPEHSTQEIAARLAMPHGTVTVMLMRLRGLLRQRLMKALAAEGLVP